MRTFPLVSVLVAISLVGCGGGGLLNPHQSGSGGGTGSGSAAGGAGDACTENHECPGAMTCVNAFPGGYCSMRCNSTSECGGDGVCVKSGDEAFCMASCASPGRQSSCRGGYSCYALSSGRSSGFCAPSNDDSPPLSPPKAPIGASCASNTTCGTNTCFSESFGWPGGYCSKGCTTSDQCGAGATCLSDIDACVELCETPWSQSSCRAGYTCWGLQGRTDGFCRPDEKAPTGAACSSSSDCEDGVCESTKPGGYCSRSCEKNSDCQSGSCLTDSRTGSSYCVSKCPAPGGRSTCRTGYVCSPYAAPTTGGFCEPEAVGGGGAGGGGGGSGGSGGAGGAPATVITYQVKSIAGTWSGNAVNVVSASRTDMLSMNSCTFTPPTTINNGGGFIGTTSWTKSFTVNGTTTCPAGNGSSTAAPSCTSQTINTAMTSAEWTVEMSGWTDDAPVIFKMRYPPHGLPGCNYANVIMDAANLWGIQGSTTVGKFRAGAAFDVRFVGSRALYSGTKSSDVSWDFTLKIQPN